MNRNNATNAHANVQRNDNIRTVFVSAVILTVAGIIVKALGFLFRVPLTNLLGDRGMAYYAPAYDIYTFLLVISTSGIPVAISRMVAERCAVCDFMGARRVIIVSRRIAVLLGMIGFLILFFGADLIAKHIVNIPNSAFAMKTIAPALLLVPAMSAYRGYFQGHQQMLPSAISEIVEQFFRVCFGLGAALFFVKSYTSVSLFIAPKLELGAGGGSFGASAGAFFGLLTIYVMYRKVQKQEEHFVTCDDNSIEKDKDLVVSILSIAVPITIAASVMPLVNLADVAIVKHRLVLYCSEAEAEALFGQLTSFAAPIIGFPQIIIQAIMMSIVPAISSIKKAQDFNRLNTTVESGLKLSMLVAFPCSIGIFVLAVPILAVFYPTRLESALNSAPTLRVYAVAFIFLALLSVATAVLQGIGKQTVAVRNLMIGIVIKIILTWVLTGVEFINARGAAVGTIGAYSFAAVTDVLAVRNYTGITFNLKKIYIKPFVASIGMGIIVHVVYYLLYGFFGKYLIPLSISIIAGAVVYFLLTVKIGLVTKEDIELLPKGSKLAHILRMDR